MNTALIDDVKLLRSELAGDEPEIEVTFGLPRGFRTADLVTIR